MGARRSGAKRAAGALALALLVQLAALVLVSRASRAASVRTAGGQNPSLVNPLGPVAERETWAYKAERPSISEVLQSERARKPVLTDPLAEVILAGHAPDGMDNYVKEVHERLKDEIEKGTVRWLDTADRRGREEVADVAQYCARLFASKGTDSDCVVQCAPPVDCGEQGARLCKELYDKGNGDPFRRCVDRESMFCRKNGPFHGEKYPAFRVRGDTEGARIESVTEYCGNLMQWRGIKLPCLRTCTLFQMRHKRPDDYFIWKARQRRRFDATHSEGATRTDPTDPPTVELAAWTECEKRANNLCQFVEHDYWKECYERNKLSCTRTIGSWNRLQSMK